VAVAPKSSLKVYKRIAKERGVLFFMDLDSVSERRIGHEFERDQLDQSPAAKSCRDLPERR
jgi:hypothetical protein